MAYKLLIANPKCASCGKKAYWILKNRFNETVNHYCGKCIDGAVERQKSYE